ncbi:CBS domain-containing protein [Antarctobacter jejuensis]|uniref:CBS domain-containing protein n=1 Tax=Antarctobacter jejuensis TaxID=1439938 RepID=UPI003FCEF177
MIINSIDQVLNNRPLISVPPGASVKEACDLLAQHNIGALTVVEDGGLVGIISERDVINRCIGKDLTTGETTVAEIMTPDPETVRPTTRLADALTRMIEGGFRHLPVTDAAGEPIGMLSMRDIPTEYRLMVDRVRELRDPDVAAQ